MAVNQYIPKRITYVHDTPETVEEYWENSDKVMKKIKVAATWPVETGKDLEKSIQWAGGPKRSKTVEVENKPIDNIKVFGLDIRGNGGRAYKVVIDDLYYVDMREDVILDVMFETGIQAGGKLNGQFIWVKYGANLKLVRVGSELHKEFVIENARYESFVEIKPKDVQIGGMYEMKSGKIFVYLGKMKHFSFYQQYEHRGYSETRYKNQHLVVENSHVFVELRSYNDPEKTKDLKHLVSVASGSSFGTYNFDFKTAIPKFVRHIKQLEEFTVEDAAAAIREVETKQRKKEQNEYAHNYYWKHASCSTSSPVEPDFASKFNLPVWKKAFENC